MKVQRKERKGLCIGVLSGDRVLFQGPIDPATGAYRQKILHLSGITAPKFDPSTGKDQKYGFAARQFLRTRLVGEQLDFVIQKTINGVQLGHILYKGKDITIQLLKNGYAKLRDKVNAQNIEAYQDAQEDAKISQFGIWNQQGKNKAQYRFLDQNINQKDIVAKYSKKSVKVVVEQIHPSKAVIYFPEDGFLTTVNFSQVQVVVLSEKLQNGQSKSNVRAIRGVLEGQFLNREVDLYINPTSGPQNMLGYMINNKGVDVRKLLLENGFAKLGKDAMSGIPAKQFLQLKAISQSALEKGKGLWKQHKVVKSETSNEKGFQAIVLQVHSGDSLTLLKQDKNQQIRVFFPNVKAPSNNQPYSFDSKQTLRKKCAGTKVRVQIQFTKKINVKKFEGDTGELKNFTFASVFLNNQNLSEFMLSLGLISIQAPRAEEDISKYFESLMQAEEISKKQRKGIHKGGEGGKIPHFNDLSGGKGKKIDATKCKNMFQFLQDDQNLIGVVEIVLNGSRFKVRFTHQNLMAICVLDGVRSLPNEGDFKKVSQEALIYSKINANQRDIQVQLKRVDLKGVYHIRMFINKKDYALQLLENGLAICKQKSKNVPYVEAENYAKKNKKGLWKYDLNLGTLKGQAQKQFKPVNFVKNLILLQVTSGQQFYLDDPNAKKPNVPQKPQKAQNVVIGGYYAVKFTDNVYYRAKILRQSKGLYYVHYVDFGNYDNVEKQDIGVLPEDLKKVKSSLYKCSLFGLDNCTKQSANLLKDFLEEKMKVEFKQEQSEDNQYRVVLTTEKGEVINEILLEQGQAQCVITNPAWQKKEEQAKKKRLGRWAQEDD